MKRTTLKFTLISLAAMLFLSGCLVTRQEMEGLQVDIVRLKKTLVEVQKNQADVLVEMQTLNTNLEAMNAQLEESRSRMSLLSSHLDDLDANLSNRLDLLSELLSGSKLASNPSPSTLYKLAYEDYSRRKYDKAVEGFKGYLSGYPEGEMAANAQFYLGECYFARQMWKEALAEYDKVLKSYPMNTVIPSAYFKKAQTLEELKDIQGAADIYEIIVKKYPYRKETMASRSRLEELKPASPNKGDAKEDQTDTENLPAKGPE